MAIGTERRNIILVSTLLAIIVLASLLVSGAYSQTQPLPPPDPAIVADQSYLPLVANMYATQCQEGIVNGSFENDSDWIIPTTEFTASYSTAVARTGDRSMRIGILDPLFNRFSYSSARQIVTLPDQVTSAQLHFWLYPLSGDPTDLNLSPT
ncbi:MAG: hypothetical protein JSV68_21815, partial [Anaerolineaceae bacterium]